jgi:integrase
MASHQPAAPAARQLKLFTPADDGGADPTAAWTVAEFFRGYFVPVCLAGRAAQPRTVREYATSVRLWTELSGDPPLAAIDEFVCARFVEQLRSQRGIDRRGPMSAETVRKHCLQLQMILDRAGPRLRRDAPTARLLAEVPYIPRPGRRPRQVAPMFAPAELAAIIERGCAIARAPRCASDPPRWWRALWRLAYLTGFRIGTLLRWEFSWLRGAAIEIPGHAYKGGQPRTFPLSSETLAIIEELRAGGSARLLPWPHSESYLHAWRRKILAAAGLPPERRLGFHAVRRLHGTTVYRISPVAGARSLGHRNIQTFERHYAAEELWREALEQLPRI